jgi:hypothetical protein
MIEDWDNPEYHGCIERVLLEDNINNNTYIIDMVYDCITTLLGCDLECDNCEGNYPEKDIYCPYMDRVEYLKDKYNLKGNI